MHLNNMNEIKRSPHNSLSAEEGIVAKKPRNSNLELYRIICMLMIVAHHYVINSGLTSENGPLIMNCTSSNGIFLSFFGAWGKTGINCFIMITGYFMCTSKITFRKFLKLMGQIYFYRWILFTVFIMAGYESLSPQRLIRLILPFWGFSDGFVPCFIVFWLTIPFLTILVQNMNRRQHELLLLLLLGCYTLLGSLPTFHITFNYITWFGVLFLIASYIKLHPQPLFDKKNLWGWATLVITCLSVLVFIGMQCLMKSYWMGYFFVHDCNKFFPVAIAVSSFLWFKNVNLKYSKFINAFGAGTFGVLLIHANSDAMRTWLWKDTIDVVSHYTLPLGQLIIFSIGVVLSVFVVCNLIDQVRIATLEKWFLNMYDHKCSVAVDKFVKRITID